MTREIALDLLNADSESDVAEILSRIEDEFDAEWEPIGGKINNYSGIEGGPRPIHAFAELITNADDAVFHRLHREKYGDEAKEGLTTYEDAKEALLDGDEEIQIVADGERDDIPNLTVIDDGIGQPPAEFEDAFFGLFEAGARKRDWPFQQGQFGKGGTAVLPHAGERGHKLVISADHRDPGTWSWSITRKHREKYQYEYLRIDGTTPTFEGEVDGREHGTFVKVFDYDYGVKSHAPTQLKQKLRPSIWRTPIPVRIIEDRHFPDSSDDSVFKGGFDGIDSYPELIEDDWSGTYDFGGRLGERDYRIVVARSNADLKQNSRYSQPLKAKRNNITGTVTMHKRQSVFFLVNGQTHGNLGESFIKNRCNKKQTGPDTLVFMDFSDWGAARESWADLSDLFTPDRHRLSERELADELRDGLEDILKNEDRLQEIERRRRQRSYRETDDERAEDMLKEFVKKHPDAKRFLSNGHMASFTGTEKEAEEPDFDPPFFPTKLNIITKLSRDGNHQIWDKEERYTQRQAVNRRSKIRLELDAPNDYFVREKAPGELDIQPENLVKNRSLSEGVLFVELKEPEFAQEGDRQPMKITVTRPQHSEDLSVEYAVEYVEPAPKNPSGGESNRNRSEDNLNFPKMREVTEDKWDRHGWNENDILSIAEDDGGMEFFINVDAAPLRGFLTRENIKNDYHTEVTRLWKLGITVYGVGMLHGFREELRNNGSLDKSADELVSTSMKGVAQTMLYQHISDNRLDTMKA